MTTGEIIKRIRMVCNLTQSEFAKEIGVNKKSVSVWELDKKQPSDEILKEIADMFLVEFEELKYPEYTEIQSIFKPNNAVRIINNEIHRYEAYLNNVGHGLDEKVYFGIRMKIEDLLGEYGYDNAKEYLSKAILYGYEIEQEPLYYAKVKGWELTNNKNIFWNYRSVLLSSIFSRLCFGDKESDNIVKTKLTKEEWNELGINDTNADFDEGE